MTEQLFESAQLALAAFANLLGGETRDQRTALERARMTSTLAQQFADRYPTIVTQFNDTPAEGGMNTGFSATVFKDSAGNLTVAFRGMDKDSPGTQSDLPAALDIFGSGAAYDQIVAMVNWWARASAAPNQMEVQQFRLASYSVDAIPADAVVLRSDGLSAFVLEAAARLPAFTGERNISEALADPNVRVNLTGQSLGGHLSMAFSSLFASRTGQVTVFNAPGFSNTTANQDFFSRLGGSASIPEKGGQAWLIA